MGDLKTFNIDEIKKRYNVEVFVETGTFYGDTIQWLKSKFTELHSIEIDKNLYEKADERFKFDKNVIIHHGASTEILKNILPKINKSTLFWLDAHFPGADAGTAPYDGEPNEDLRVPLYSEIQEIAKRKTNFKDVIIIDDLWLYEDGPYEWGSFDEHNKKHNRDIKREKIVSKDSSFLYEAFKDTHDYNKFYNHQGYLIFVPKNIK